MTLQPRIGGSFAPPITEELLTSYKELANSAEPEIKDYMLNLIAMVEAYNEEEESTEPSVPHPSGTGTITLLTKDAIKNLWDHVPWPAECDAYQAAFEKLPATDHDNENAQHIREHKADGGKGLPEDYNPSLRNAAFHLLWFAKELSEDRQPLTNDKL